MQGANQLKYYFFMLLNSLELQKSRRNYEEWKSYDEKRMIGPLFLRHL